MTPDDLRSLADALHWVQYTADWQACERAAAHLRACADAQPVRAVPIGHALSAVRHVGSANYPDRERAAIEQLYSAEFDAYTHPAPAASQAEQPIDLDAVAMQQMRQAAAESTWMPSEYTSNDWIADVCRWLRDGPPAAAPQAEPSAALIRAYNSGYMQGHHDTVEAQFIVIHPLDMDTYHADVVAELGLTAAPQAEPCIGNDSACPCQDGDACHYKDAADGTKAWPVPQAEPVSDPRPCTCHPDDSPPVPCARKYALSECRAASGEPTEAQIEAATVALYSYFGDEQSRLFLKSVADDVLRSALAAKDE